MELDGLNVKIHRDPSVLERRQALMVQKVDTFKDYTFLGVQLFSFVIYALGVAITHRDFPCLHTASFVVLHSEILLLTLRVAFC